jgi:hypothetical protein
VDDETGPATYNDPALNARVKAALIKAFEVTRHLSDLIQTFG